MSFLTCNSTRLPCNFMSILFLLESQVKNDIFGICFILYSLSFFLLFRLTCNLYWFTWLHVTAILVGGPSRIFTRFEVFIAFVERPFHSIQHSQRLRFLDWSVRKSQLNISQTHLDFNKYLFFYSLWRRYQKRGHYQIYSTSTPFWLFCASLQFILILSIF